jgi:hypothetical protein
MYSRTNLNIWQVVLVILLVLAGFCLTAETHCPQFQPGLPVGTVAHNSLDEISGIAASRSNSDVLWVHNDKGGLPRVFAMNRQGMHLGIYNLSGAVAIDYEDMAIGPGMVDGVDYLYVGDIGDNDSERSYITVYRVAEPAVDSRQSPVETALDGVETIRLQYPDGARDAETLMVDPVTKDIYIISKRDSLSRVYRAPYPQSTTMTTTMEYKCELPWNRAAGGDISLEGDMIIVRTGDGGYDNASIWLRPEGTNLWDAFSGTECAVELLWEENGEAVCFDGDGRGYYTTSEQLHQPIYYFAPVNSNLLVPEQFPTIQEAINAAVDGDIISVAPGICEEEIDFLGKAIIVQGAPAPAILDGIGGFAVSFFSDEDSNSVLRNFVIRNSYMGIFLADSSPTICNVTVCDNEYAVAAFVGAQPDISNSIFWNNTEIDLLFCQARYSCIEDADDGLGNISDDPLFFDPSSGDYHLKSEGWSWDTVRHRWTYDDVTSRCIDAGNPGSPLGDELLCIPDDPNNIWGQNLRINMGAFGGTAEASMPPYDWALLSDITSDGISDFSDLEIFSSLWLDTGEQLYADFNWDGIVDLFDFALFARDWLGQTSWH